MSGILLGLVIIATLMATTSSQTATITVTGTLIDLYCYAQDKSDTGMHHGESRECAWACVKYTGMPVGLLTAEGRTYEIVGPWVADNNARIAPFITQRVRITGGGRLERWHADDQCR
ncbi:MAG: hypothetical protein QM736_00630 [Vicinamibacterales bacterium]